MFGLFIGKTEGELAIGVGMVTKGRSCCWVTVFICKGDSWFEIGSKVIELGKGEVCVFGEILLDTILELFVKEGVDEEICELIVAFWIHWLELFQMNP